MLCSTATMRGSILSSASSVLMVTGPAISNGSPFSRIVKVYPNLSSLTFSLFPFSFSSLPHRVNPKLSQNLLQQTIAVGDHVFRQRDARSRPPGGVRQD